jgi:hypothetical protein
MRSFIFSIPFVFLGASFAQAQPVSWGMAQCSALMEVMETHVSKQPQKDYLADAKSLLFDAAVEQSRAEGRDPYELTTIHRVKQSEWEAVGYSMAFKAEFRDWTDYCRSLARSYKIALHQSMLR